ncbi:MAG: flagellin [Alphaproteobacteria bacterium]|jgi:flagellin
MANSQVTLTAAMRSNLTTLQATSNLLDRTQERLSTGKKVNTALDNPTNFFSAAAHTTRANNLTSRKDGMSESVQAIKATNAGIEGIKALLESANGIIATASTASSTSYSTLYEQFNTLVGEVNDLIEDSKYKGTNFLGGTAVTLDVIFNESGTNKLTLTGFDAQFSALLNSANIGADAATAGGFSLLAGVVDGGSAATISLFQSADGTAAGFSIAANLTAISNGITAALSVLEAQSTKLSSNLSIVNARLDFTNEMVNIELAGADNLTLADQNEEGANMLMLQTRNQLGTTSLSLASQAAQGILRLF